MSGFKLLAIRPLKGCSKKFSKNLKEGMIYKFYQDYTFQDEEGIEIKIENNNLNSSFVKINSPTNKIDLYSNDDLEINISVIIGENGSGKSTLIDLMCALAFLIFRKYPTTYKNTLSKLKRERKELFEFCNSSIKRIRKNKELNFKEFSHNHLRRYHETEEKLLYLNNKSDLDDFFGEFYCEFYFEKNNTIYKVHVNNGDFNFFILEGESWNAKILSNFNGLKNSFFYSILLNYSIYSFRKSIMGDWVELLYHKNDGYKTPVVINPMKTDGNLEVNNEIHLQTQRTFNSILSSPKILNREISEIWFTLKDIDDDFDYLIDVDQQLIKRSLKENSNGASSFSIIVDEKTKNLSQIIFSEISFIKESFKLLDEKLSLFEQSILKYFIRKTVKYYLLNFYSDEKNVDHIQVIKFNTLLLKINANNSFREKKINAAKWLLSFKELNSKFIFDGKNNFFLKFKSHSDFKELSKKHNFLESDPLCFMQMDFIFSDKSTLSQMSSGQLQLLNSLNTITYHLRNLDSTNYSYKYVNIILDEVELYLHPEFQRKYISLILDGIKSTNLTKIKGVNILVLTHSPFVLSDVISNNVLHLKDGFIEENSTIKNSFGANIYDLLHDSFFMSEGFIGAFAQEKIDKVFTELSNKLNDSKYELKTSKENIKSIIDIIGEPLIQRQLSTLYDHVFHEDLESNIINRQIKALEVIRDRKNKKS